jgi:hypothetical protein
LVNYAEATVATYRETPRPDVAVVVCLLFLAVSWIAVGNRYFTGGEAMEKPTNRIAQLYGYSVCLIAVIIFVYSLQNVIENLIDRSNPLQTAYGYGSASLDSFEAFKATYASERSTPFVSQNPSRPAEKTSDAELRAQYEALRASRISSETFRTTKDLTVSGVMLLVAIVLFVLHWRWLRTLSTA